MASIKEQIDKLYGIQNDTHSEFYIEPEEFEIVRAKSAKNGLKKRDGLLLSNFTINLSSVKNLELRSDDTFVIGFPKSGTTWIEEITWLIKNGLDFERAKNEFHYVRVPWIDAGFSKIIIDNMPSPRVFKAHLPIKFLPDSFNKKAKVVYCVRNPKDVLVSTFNYSKSLIDDESSGTLEDMADDFVNGIIANGSYWDHLNQYGELENVHFVHYEDLIEEPIKTVTELAKYLEVELTESQIKMLLAFVSFDNMKKLPTFDMKVIDRVYKSDIEFFKKGKIGTWREYLSEEISNKIDVVMRDNLKYKRRPIRYVPSKEI